MNKWMIWFHRWGSPAYFYERSGFLEPYLVILAVVLLLTGAWTGLFVAPMDYQQKDAFRIIYVHVPCALLSLSIYTFMGLCSLGYLIWHVKMADVLASVSAPIGAGVTALALLTGSIWGKPMWGTWWVWDARLTSELILLFLYLGYLGLRSGLHDHKTKAKACAILAVMGCVDIPIIHYSVEWWQTLHQGPTLSKFGKPSMPLEMLYPLLLMLAGFYSFFMSAVLYNAKHEILWRERKAQWVKDMFMQGRLK